MFRLLRRLLLALLVISVFAAVIYSILLNDRMRRQQIFDTRMTLAVATAVQAALFEATRTAEADLPQYRLVQLGVNQPLAEIAARYNTTVEVLRIANGLKDDVEAGNGETIVVPEGVQALDPPRRFRPYIAIPGDTLNGLAARFNVPPDLIQLDNPLLAARGVQPGDIVFIAELF